ncbi:MAG TPA: hypothetical protein VNG51_06200 [Ktedonobacteraceae bacterium]|nr:hypothetical protein [Ktedonobacteraceae bacterium]
MNNNADRLYNLLPAVYRIRDVGTGWQLQALLRVIAEQVNVVEADIAQLYENWFIETCQDWVVPYIGDLVGYQQVHEAGEPGDITTQEGQELNAILISRRDVANTIRYRRRKGTLALLEQLAKAVANWPYAYAVEFYKYLGVTQNDNFERSERGRLLDIRDNSTLYTIGSPFAREAHTVDVRRIVSTHSTGRYNIPSVGLFIWRLKVYPVTYTHAYCDEDAGKHCFTFSVLGNDGQLYTNPAPLKTSDGQPTAVDELNFPNPISLRAFKKRLTDYYGDIQQGKSLEIWTIEASREEREAHEFHESHEPQEEHHEQHHEQHPHHEHHEEYGQHGHHEEHEQHEPELVLPAKGGAKPQQPPAQAVPPQPQPVTPDRIIPADLSEWKYRPPRGKVAVDTRLGRIVFPPGHAPKEVYASYFYAFSTDMGGGAYHRPMLQPADAQLFQVQKVPMPLNTQRMPGIQGQGGSAQQPRRLYSSITDALAAWEQWKEQNAQQPQPLPEHGVIEIIDNGVYTEQLAIELEQYERLTLRAADRGRPVLRLVDWDENKSDSLKITGEYGSRFTLDGLLIEGRPVQFEGTIDAVYIRHCTLVPGWGVDSECTANHPAEASLLINQRGQTVNIEKSIVGSLLIYQDEVREEPLHINISDSILDATDEKLTAINAPDDEIAYAILSIVRTTVFGQILVHALDTAENSIFRGLITVARRQRGCMRFCSYVPGSRVPRRYACQPDLVDAAVDERLKTQPRDVRDAAKQLEHDRVLPRFNSTRYGNATYCQLALTCALEIAHGADDESEMGVFHDLFQPQRAANLRARLDDFTPAGMETGIIYVS